MTRYSATTVETEKAKGQLRDFAIHRLARLTHDTFHVIACTVIKQAADKNDRREQSNRLESKAVSDMSIVFKIID